MRREKGSAGEEWCIRCANNASSDRSTKGRGVGSTARRCEKRAIGKTPAVALVPNRTTPAVTVVLAENPSSD